VATAVGGKSELDRFILIYCKKSMDYLGKCPKDVRFPHFKCYSVVDELGWCVLMSPMCEPLPLPGLHFMFVS